MLRYCRTCPDKYSETCALPSKTERVVTAAAVVGAMIIDSFAAMCARTRGIALPEDSMDIIETSRTRRAVAHVSAEACIYVHQISTQDEA